LEQDNFAEPVKPIKRIRAVIDSSRSERHYKWLE